MRRLVGIALATSIAVWAAHASAQVSTIVVGSKMDLKVWEDVGAAADIAKVRPKDQWSRAFKGTADQQPGAVAHAYDAMSSEARVKGLADFMIVKSLNRPASALTPSDLYDFHWGYVGKGFKFYPVRLTGFEDIAAQLQSVEVGGSKYEFGENGHSVRGADAMVLPSDARGIVQDVTVTFEIGTRKAVWTGRPAGGIVEVSPATTSQGCEIHVRSDPGGATVFFNGTQWHRRTETKSVHAPGEWEVIVRLDGYKEWRAKRTLGPGQSWVIGATLSK